MQYAKSAYGTIPSRVASANRNSDNGWGGYEWSLLGLRRVPSNLLGTARYKDLALVIRRELVSLTVLMWQIAEAVGYKIHSTNPNGNGEHWGPWGYEDRPIGGTVSPSNHSRGRAEDDNAPYNPMVSSFITDMHPGYVNAREQCGFYWGGRYNGKTDTMHFEYVGRPEDVAADERRARQILEALTAPKPTTPTPSKPVTPASVSDEDDFMAMFSSREDFRAFVRAEVVAGTAETLRSEGVSGAADHTQDKQRIVDAVAEVLRSEGVSGAGDAGALASRIAAAISL